MGAIPAVVRAGLGLWVPVGAWCGLIFALSATPNLNSGLGAVDILVRKAGHMAEYAILFLLTRRALAGSGMGRDPLRAAVYAFVFSCIYAFSDEVHQAFVPTRGPSFADVGIDVMGAVAGMAVYMIHGRTRG